VSFKALVGQQTVVRAFQAALAGDKLAHAYLIVGPEGVGKRTFAREAARALLCKRGGVDACDVCSSCRRILAGDLDPRPPKKARKGEPKQLPYDKHPDFHWVEPVALGGRSVSEEDTSGRNITIEQALGLHSDMQFKPFESRYKVAIVAECDMLRTEAANSLLKLFEEPPPATIIFLTTARPRMVLETIVSRCQMIRMTALAAAAVEAILTSRFDIDSARARRLAEVSDGSVSRALWMGGAEGEKLKQLALDVMSEGTKLDEEKAATNIANKCMLMGRAEGVKGKKRLREYVRQEAKEVLAFIAAFYNDISRFHVTGKVSGALGDAWEMAVRKQANEVECDDAVQAVNFALEAAAYIDQNVDVELVLGDFLRRSAKRRSRLPV